MQNSNKFCLPILITFFLIAGCGKKDSETLKNKNIEANQPATTEAYSAQSYEETKLEKAKNKYGSLKISTFIKECELKFHGSTYEDIITKPERPDSGDDSLWRAFTLTPYLNEYGRETEVVITVSTKSRNRFNEEYKNRFDCKFEGAPHWQIISEPKYIEKKEIAIDFPKNYKFTPTDEQEEITCVSDSDCPIYNRCRLKSYG
jgi:hypothetical protein